MSLLPQLQAALFLILLPLSKSPSFMSLSLRPSSQVPMDALLYYDALAIFYLQHYLYHIPHLGTVATAISSLGDPRYSYIVTFPVVYWLLGATAGHHVILTAAIGEWLNITLKWLVSSSA